MPARKTHRVTPHKPEVVTVKDILTRDDINGILKDLADKKDGIVDMVVIYLDKDNRYHWEITNDTLSSTVVWMLESTKLDILNEDCEG